MSQAKYQNRHIPERASVGRMLEKWIGIPFNFIEIVLSYLFVRPWQYALSKLDALSYKLEGTLFREIVSHTLLPITLIVTYFIGSKFATDGFTVNSLFSFSMILVSYGLIFAPMERLFPWSREWLDGGNDVSVDVMMFYSSAIWNAVAKFIVAAFALTFIIEKLEPIGHDYWPSFLHPVFQVFLLILLKDFLRYWYHRALHEIPFLWRFHSVHHSVERLYWLNGLRAHPGEIVSQVILFAIPVALLQPSQEIVVLSIFMSLSIGVFQHSNIGLKLGIWEYIFSVGDNHRYHHYPNEIGDSNYGDNSTNPRAKSHLTKLGLVNSPIIP